MNKKSQSKIKSILFIIPPYFNFDSFENEKLGSIPTFTIPYGILSLSAYLKKYTIHNLKIEILDLNVEAYNILTNKLETKKNDDIKHMLYNSVQIKLEKSKYDIVGISALFNNAYNYLEKISKLIKESCYSPLCIIGGGLASNLFYEILDKHDNIDAACLAEGEIPLLDLINSTDMNFLITNHNSWITKKKMKSNFIFKPSYVENLDDIPILEYNLIDLKYYNGRSVDKKHADSVGKREFSIHTSRGCPYMCVYCSNTSIHGKKVRYMSLSRIIDEVDFMINNHGMNVLLIEDDHFLADVPRAIEVLYKLGTKNIRIEFPNGISVRGINKELGIALKYAGVSSVNLAVESGSNYVLKKLIKKPHLIKHIKPAVEILRNNDIRVHAFIVLGLPGEYEEHRKETLDMLNDVGFDWVYLFLAVPIVGSRLYDICIENDYLINKDFSNHLVSNPTIKAPGVDPNSISDKMYLMNLDVNFVNNWNVKNNRAEIALPYFESIIKKFPNHALAYYVLIHIYHILNYNVDKINPLKTKYNELIDNDIEWKNHINYFKLTI